MTTSSDQTQARIRALVAKILWSKVTEIGGGKCYLQTNLDDVAAELADALVASPLVPGPVGK
jgi:hypothetical protein